MNLAYSYDVFQSCCFPSETSPKGRGVVVLFFFGFYVEIYMFGVVFESYLSPIYQLEFSSQLSLFIILCCLIYSLVFDETFVSWHNPTNGVALRLA